VYGRGMPVLGANQSIPTSTDAEALAWLENFAAVIDASPTTYGLDAPTASDIDTVVLAFRTAYDIAGVAARTAVNPGGYTQPNRAAMYDARDAALAFVRPIAVQIQANPGISDEDKLTAGIVPRNFSRTKIFVPSTAPILGFLTAGIGTHMLAFADEMTPSSKRKPLGALQLQLYLGIGAAQVALNDLKFYAGYSRNPALVNFDPADAGKLATYASRWVGTRGDVGPWSASLVATILFSEAPGG
jgi:hypothetical protein